jgi:glycosyltransferase involved in cell wall biosynthesis
MTIVEEGQLFKKLVVNKITKFTEEPKLCLNMIVKDEGHIIEDTLTKLLKKVKIDYWVISDTGSTDDTKTKIIDFFKNNNINGELYCDSWKDFGHNRTAALNHAYNKSKYLLIFDADDEICGDFVLPELTKDSYYLKFGNPSGTTYIRTQLVNNHKKWKYVGVLHEYITCMENTNGIETLDSNYYTVSGRTSSRNKDANKYLKDALILEKAYEEAVANKDEIYNRYGFYCANSYFDCGKHQEAIKWYKITLNNKNWEQEKYVSCLKIFLCYKTLGQPDTGFYYLVNSFNYDKERVECLYELVSHYCGCEQNDIAYGYFNMVKSFYNEKYIKADMSSKLFHDISKPNLYLPYYMIIVADRVKDITTGIQMYKIIFTKKYPERNTFYIKNILFNLRFFIEHAKKDNEFLQLFKEYINFLKTINFPLYSFDFLKDYAEYGIDVESILNIKVAKGEPKFSKEDCMQSKNILFYTGFANTQWNYSYINNNALGGSEKAVAYLSKSFPKDYTVYVSGDIAAEEFDNVKYLSLRELPKLFDTIPFHTIICSRYVSFLEMFNNPCYYQFYIWAHDCNLIPYGANISDSDIVIKWDKYIDGCICQTEWHANEYKKKYPTLSDKIHIINNGINTSFFPVKNKKKHNKFIYTSRTERGLIILLALWPKILEYLPDAELVISTYTKFPLNQEEEQIKAIIDSYSSIKHLGQLNTEQLYLEMSTAEYWLFPSIYPETSCITALEMLMSEVICLYYPYAGLPYTIKEYGIQIETGNEIEKLINITTKEKFDLRVNGRKYAESCSWLERAKLWSDTLSLNNNCVINKSSNVTNVTNVAIFNSFNFHYEMFGCVINYCNKNNFKLTIFTKQNNELGWLEFYKKHFKTCDFEYKDISEFEQLKNEFDIIFITTDDDYGFKQEWINDKCISINHHYTIRVPEYKHNLAIRPFIDNLRDWAIPCYSLLNMSDKQHTLEPEINIAIIGQIMNLNYDVINRLESNTKINLHICGRANDNVTNNNLDIIKSIVNSNISVNNYFNIGTTKLFNLLKKCDYILTDCSNNTDHINGQSSSGCIPVAISTLTPLIISKTNNKLYNFKNVLEFELKSEDKIYINKGDIDSYLLLEEREVLISMFDKYMDNKYMDNNCINDENNLELINDVSSQKKHTALIVEPRDIKNLDKLINDYKTKLGKDWNIVFYCGKSLKSKWVNTLLDPSVEIRELNVNNFNPQEYSDFFKSKELWESLDGEYILVFQADAFIINSEPYNVDYFIKMNKSYIGGNMCYEWAELKNENLFIKCRNFNGGLSLRKRIDMIKIISTFGSGKTESNSIKFQSYAEDVYFTVGCYKLNMPLGDDESCENFALHTIHKSDFFGIHNPSKNILEQIKSNPEMNNYFEFQTA